MTVRELLKQINDSVEYDADVLDKVLLTIDENDDTQDFVLKFSYSINSNEAFIVLASDEETENLI
jgi:hypothetical protein